MSRARGAQRVRWRDESLEWLAIEAGAEAAEMLAWARRLLALEEPVDAAPLVRSLAFAQGESVAAAAIDLAAAWMSNANDPPAWLHRAAPADRIGAIEAEIARMARLGFPRVHALARIAKRCGTRSRHSRRSESELSAALDLALALDGSGGRAELVRGAWEIRRGHVGRARRAFERLARGGRAPAWRDAAAVGLAFCELALGRPQSVLAIDVLATDATQELGPARTLLHWNRLVAAAELGLADGVDAASDALGSAMSSRAADPSLAEHRSLVGHLAARLRGLMARLETRRRDAWPILARLEMFAEARGLAGFLGSSGRRASASAPSAFENLGLAAASVVIPSAKPDCARPS